MKICADAEDWLTLSFLPGLGCVHINRLVLEAGSPGEALRRLLRSRDCAGGGERVLVFDRRQLTAARDRARQEMDDLARLDVSLLSPACSQFPESLRTIPDPPVLLYYRGTLECLLRPVVAIIGSRAATEYGRRIGAWLAAELAAQDITVASGVASGIDASAHRGVIEAGGRTVGVLGCGIDVVYPRTHADLYREIAAHGVLFSEYGLGSPPEGFRFPVRNRIISGLSRGVVVVEATEKSGSLITARLALDQGREVFAVPGRIDSPRSAGSHRLIQQGAHLVQTVRDIVEVIAWGDPHIPPVRHRQRSEPVPLGERERALLAHLDVYPTDIDSLSRQSGFPAAELHALLLQLELKGAVRQLPGQLYERARPPG